MDDLKSMQDPTLRSTVRGVTTFLPEPDPADLFCPIISVDDHALEPPTLFHDRLPGRLRQDAPHVDYDDEGIPFWVIDGARLPVIILNGASGRPMREWNLAPQKYEEFRLGVYDVDHRVRDMDLNGVWASLNFASSLFGFAGTRFVRMADQDVALACVRAWNDWMIDEWCGAHPDRFIPCQLPWLHDVETAADMVRANALRGYTAVSFSENPEGLGLPSVHTGYWDPFFRACQETGTVVNLHVGSSGNVQRPSSDSPSEVMVALFPVNGMLAAVDWIFAKIPVRFPELKIALSEAGFSWVPTVIERLDRAFRQREASDTWVGVDEHPTDLLRRNFWFTSIEDPYGFRQLDLVGVENVMVESDYPHMDSSWPDTQSLLRRQLGHLDDVAIRRVCFENAAALYRHAEPPAALVGTSAVGRSTGG
jgi:predicted TIM-barrel fold metal-dependent hydrolase